MIPAHSNSLEDVLSTADLLEALDKGCSLVETATRTGNPLAVQQAILALTLVLLARLVKSRHFQNLLEGLQKELTTTAADRIHCILALASEAARANPSKATPPTDS